VGLVRVEDFTFRADRPDRAIDWVLVPAGWTLSEHRPVDATLSDHRPVVARVKVP
jgi:endonuclease/exonuclease/phosphatase family metal-dependent hydrolase